MTRARARMAKIDALRAAGVDPYPVRFDRTATARRAARALRRARRRRGDRRRRSHRGPCAPAPRRWASSCSSRCATAAEACSCSCRARVVGDDAFDADQRSRSRRLGRRRRHGHEDEGRRALGEGRDLRRCSRRRCGRCPTSGTASATSTRDTASATSTSSRTTRPRRVFAIRFAAVAAIRADLLAPATSRSRRRCCSRSRAARPRARS